MNYVSVTVIKVYTIFFWKVVYFVSYCLESILRVAFDCNTIVKMTKIIWLDSLLQEVCIHVLIWLTNQSIMPPLVKWTPWYFLWHMWELTFQLSWDKQKNSANKVKCEQAEYLPKIVRIRIIHLHRSHNLNKLWNIYYGICAYYFFLCGFSRWTMFLPLPLSLRFTLFSIEK